MKEFEQAVTAAVSTMVSNGKLNEIIESHVAKTVDHIVGDALRSYSDFGKNLKEAVEKAISFDADELGIGGYNHVVLEVVRRKINGSLLTIGAKQIEEDMEKLLSAAVPGEVTTTNLYKDLAEWARDYNGCEKHQRPTMILGDTDYSTRWIYLDGKPDQDRYACAFRMLVREDGTIASLSISGRDVSKTLFMGSLNAFEETMFRLYAAKARIVIDDQDPDYIGLGDDDY